MKNIFSKISATTLMVLGFVVMMAGFATTATAWTSAGWNQSPNGCPTFVVANITTGEGVTSSGCWTSKNISTKVGDVINLTVYFHNETGSPVNNVSVAVSDIRNATGNVQAGGTVYANGAAVASEQAYINVPANAKLTYVKSAKGYQRDGYNYASGDLGATTSIFSYLPVGPLQSTWNDQGNVKVKFIVEATTPVPPVDTTTAPSANTNAAQVGTSTVKLSGNYGSGGLSTETWFNVFYGGTCSSSNYLGTTPRVNRGSTSGSASYDLTTSSLKGPGTYSYYVIAENSKGSINANCVSFVIDNPAPATCSNGATNPPTCSICPIGQNMVNGSCVNTPVDTTGTPAVTTYVPSSVSNNGAMLNGFYNANGLNTQVCFEIYGTNYSSRTVGCEYRGTGSGNASFNITGLNPGEYTYRVAGFNNKGENKGEWKTFTIPAQQPTSCANGAINPLSGCNQCALGYTYTNGACSVTVVNPPTQTYNAPTAQTLNPVTVNAYQSTLGGYYTTGSCAGSTWFEYGPTQALGSRTSSISRSANSAGNTSQTIRGLSANTTYYYRTVSQNCQNTAYASDIKSFTTTRPTIVDNITRVITPRQTNTVTQVVTTTKTVATPVRTAVVGGTGVKYLRLNIDNNQKEITRGDSVTYEVQWENVSSDVTLNDLVLEVSMPKELRIVDSSRGDIDRSGNAVYFNIDRLDPREEGRLTITTRMTGSLRDGDPVVGQGVMAFHNPTLEGAQENAIAYDSDHYRADSSVLGASAFGAGFLPGTLAGWLIILLIIVLIILAARHYMRSGYYADDRGDHNDGPYTPYRPQA